MVSQHPHIELKEMDAALLALELLRGVQHLTPAGRERVEDAARTASHLHRGQMRAQRGDFDAVPYIEHPLRNTVRLLRWGASEPDLLCASLLHDVAEDCADRAVQLYATNAAGTTPTERTLTWIREAYGERVAGVVEAVTNPPRDPGASDEQRLAQYAEHVRVAVASDPLVLLVKASDLTDNAGSLPHQVAGVSPDFISRRVTKYTPVVEQVIAAVPGAELDPSVASAVTDALTKLRGSLSALAGRVQAFPDQPCATPPRAAPHPSASAAPHSPNPTHTLDP